MKLGSLKSVLSIASLLSMVNLFAIVGLVGFLFGTGKLNGERVATIARVLRGEALGPAVATSQPATQPARLGASEKHIAEDMMPGEVTRRHDERVVKELQDQELLVRNLLMELISKEEALGDRETALAASRQKLRQEEQDRGFKKNLAYLSSIKPDNALALLRDMKEPDAVRFFLEMEPDIGKKIIDKCTTEEDRQWIGRILDQIRGRDVLRAEALAARSTKKKR